MRSVFKRIMTLYVQPKGSCYFSQALQAHKHPACSPVPLS